jgi:hypothetical protein
MPYYVGAGEPEWDEWMAICESVAEPPTSMFQYIEPWAATTTVLQFPETPGPRPADLGPRPQQFSPARFQQEQRAVSELALWKLSSMTLMCRAAGLKRVFGRYDGGGDESFTYFRRVEMIDGRVGPAELIAGTPINCEALVSDAAFALMGTYDAGEFVLRGALVIDFDACTITDERNIDVVFETRDD